MSERWTRRLFGALVLGLAVLIGSSPASAFERDVHFGLTRWLALQAGFASAQAQAIALGDERVDAGFLDFQTLTFDAACLGRFPDDAQRIQRFHYPATNRVPTKPEDRVVAPGSDASRSELRVFFRDVAGKEGLMLAKFGEALHPLQDSWSHQGVPAVPDWEGLHCDPHIVSGIPSARGGWASHDAELTARSPDDVVAMAKATYDALLSYPAVLGVARHPAEWSTLIARVGAFAKADTKAAKGDWFRSQGDADTSFLDTITLPDGPKFQRSRWKGDKFPDLLQDGSTQFDAPQDGRAFVDAFLHRWCGKEVVEDVVFDAMGLTRAQAGRSPAARQLAARLALWKLRDHGSAAPLVHKASAFTSTELRTIDRMTRAPDALIDGAMLNDVFFPVQALGSDASPLLPYVWRSIPASNRSIAVARLKHAPHDELGFIVEKRDNRWVLTDVVAMVAP